MHTEFEVSIDDNSEKKYYPIIRGVWKSGIATCHGFDILIHMISL